MTWRFGCAVLASALSVVVPMCAHGACPPAGHTRHELLALKDSGFVVTDNKARNELALALVDCLGSPDPQWRDAIAYEALAQWMRTDGLAAESLLGIHDRLRAQLASRTPDKAGFRQPFAALVLAGVVAADRERRFLDDAAFADLVEVAAAYFESIRDYRGFDARAGWRHGIAHGADLLTQLAVHPRTRRDEVGRIVDALATQIAPQSGHFYIHGEPERMALPLIYIAQRGVYTPQEWREWFAGIAAIPEEGSLYASQAGLSRRHNLQALLLVLHVNISESKDEALRANLLPVVTEALRALQ